MKRETVKVESKRDVGEKFRDKTQYFLALGVIASLLLVAKIPIFVVLFFAVFIFFIAKMFSNSGRHQTRSIFEFYLSANEIIRNDLRRWYGFELNDAIDRGERIVASMPHAPSLVHFSLGALYSKIDDHSSAVKHLSYVSENPKSFESNIVYPSPELRNYVHVLRKIEREPSEAPLTSAAVRSLERLRRIRADVMLAQSRSALENAKNILSETAGYGDSNRSDNMLAAVAGGENRRPAAFIDVSTSRGEYFESGHGNGTSGKANTHGDDPARKPITEVLHDIYDRNVS
ncbi:MAG: hypothetical protein ACRD6X_03200 [Pyrinomonadaceae bacterium]